MKSQLNCEQLPKPIDCDALLGRCMGRIDLMQRILNSFVDRVGDDVETLVTAIAKQDSPEISRLAHKIKGASMTVSAVELANTAESIERLVDAALSDELPKMAQQLEQEQSRVLNYVCSELGGAGHG